MTNVFFISFKAGKRDTHLLSAEHDVGGPLEGVDDGLPAAVEVVVLGLDHAVVDVHGGREELAALAHLVEPVYASDALLNNALLRGQNGKFD